MRLPIAGIFANVMITTACDRACPDCCVGDAVLRAKPRVFPPTQIAAEVAALGEVGTVYLTGGEPTLHPQFDEVARLSREARGARPLWLITNGAKLAERAGSLHYFDHIRLSEYTDASNAGPPSDPDIAAHARLASPEAPIHAAPVIHIRTAGKNPCGRQGNTVSVTAGRVFGCCVAHGIDGAESTDLSPGWFDRLESIPLPCDRCVFGVA